MGEIHEVYPYLRVRSTADAIRFYARAFDAVEIFRLTEPTGRIGHAEIKIGPSIIMLSDEYPEHGLLRPAHREDPVSSCIYTSQMSTNSSSEPSAPVLP